MNHRSVNPVRKSGWGSKYHPNYLSITPTKRQRLFSNGVNKAPKSKVLKTALALFSSNGYSETKMSEIARNTGISVGALYLRFQSKEELCLALIKDQIKDFWRLTKNLPDKTPLKALKAYITLNLEYAFQKRQLISMFLREHKLPFIQPLRRNFFKSQIQIIKDILANGAKEGVFKPVNTDNTALMIFAFIRGAILLKLVFGIGDAKAMSNSIFELITSGIRKHP